MRVQEHIPKSQLRPVLFRAYEATMEHRRLTEGGTDDPHSTEKICFSQFRHFLFYVYEYGCLYHMFNTLLSQADDQATRRTAAGAGSETAKSPSSNSRTDEAGQTTIAGPSKRSTRKVLTRQMLLDGLPLLRSWGYQKLNGRESLEKAYDLYLSVPAAASSGQLPLSGDRGVFFNNFAEWASDEGLRVDY
jgi:hypothetical protein